MARLASPELFTTAPSLNSACDAGRDSSVLSKCDCNTFRIALYRSLSVTVSFRSPRRFTRRILAADVSHKAISGNNLTASTREVVRLIVALRRQNCGRSEPSELVPALAEKARPHHL